MEAVDLVLAFTLAGLTSVWRFYDGSDKGRLRQNSIFFRLFLQSTTPVALCLIGGLWAAWPFQLVVDSIPANLPLVLPVAVAVWRLLGPMPGWSEWLPHQDAEGKREWGMLLGFAAPTLAAGLAFHLLNNSGFQAAPFALSGTVVAAVYVLGSKYLPSSGPFTGEKMGRLSYGFIVFGLALL